MTEITVQNALAAVEGVGEEGLLIETVLKAKVRRNRNQRIFKCICELFAEDSRNFRDICQGVAEK
jgi:hypothetical protein